MGLLHGPVGGLLAIAAITAAAAIVLGAALHTRELAVLSRRARDQVAPPPEPPVGLPIEEIARHARRVRAHVRAVAPGTPVARRWGQVQAYDDLLAEACRALSLPDTLTELPPGLERDAERLRVEHQLNAAGFGLGP